MYSLIGVDGNAFAVMAYVGRAMKEVRFSNEEISQYKADAMSGDYQHLLCVSMDMVDTCNKKAGYDEYEEYED